MKTIRIVYVNGVAGNSLYINDYRVAGSKPWGGGKILREWDILEKDILRALNLKPRAVEYECAKDLAIHLWEKHYKDKDPEWEPCDDLMGVLTQIDNMTVGLNR